ncbi:MAG: CDP-6-deoxy-delta-3,4-glucoseen reductase [gamma proteobacterium symbiont of Bathyaustriella thionipta]|nr:CDP-6-deoxy-delta-3,4-glucoseen reductase [gamma proteobacterium symbiont of Bathyaustriella thionipta]MCU7949962.1 CDP-6-deoxy-delta-3,4-glucoseen reductase [gamma proteobacterium symbiont of Bathyaustriella thionipta]MCU7953617.1 CDP-6-deoxy-delta-3,4-glucoseen reductase [gamma proteobacterium symbiont of Bathyaustriella thionipta]MCU7956534.1 CDP-6-deoxy-delta-3,4-glucoseen reductase [gamma proteobacterium symbiont of Bathyaustriella thionipta]MCU7968797.1 CDP-6-deoxy-delta-3,4-glucoseen 
MRHRVEIKPSEHQFYVESDETVLDAALRQGINLRYGCRNGACGSCKGKLLAGDIHYDEEPIALTDEDQEQNQVLFCAAHVDSELVIEVEEVELDSAIELKTLPCRVHEMEHLADDVMQVFIKLPASERLQFLPGQYIDILLEDGRHRSFSIANAPHNDEFLELHIRLVEQGLFTPKVFNSMQNKDLLRIEGPHGSFFFHEDSNKDILFVAGGTGFAPIKGIIEHLISEQITRPITLYWGVRSEADLYMSELAEKWVAEQSNITFVPVLSDAGEDWSGRTGYVHEAVLADFEDLSVFDIYTCGPPAMIKAAEQTFQEKGMNKNQFFYDSFDFSNDQ